MLLTFALYLVAQQPLDLVMTGKYEDAIKASQTLIAQERSTDKIFGYMVDIGDIYYDKLGDRDKALQAYEEALRKFPARKDLYLVHYRIGQVLELEENFMDAARAYEIVATQYRKAPYDSFSLEGVERCFKKNYQDSVATVDGQRITRLEFDERIATLPPFGREEYEKQEGKKKLIDQMVMERLLWTSALKENVDKDTAVMRKISEARRRTLIDEVTEREITQKSSPTEKQMRSFFVKNRNDYKLPADVRAREIVVKNETLALAVLDTLKLHPELWDTLAKRYSTAVSKDYGGDMGYVTRGSRQVEVETVIFNMKLNRVSSVTKIYEDFGIYKVLEKRPPRYRSFKDAKSDVEYRLKGEIRGQVEKKFTDALRGDSDLKILMKGDTLAYLFGAYLLKQDLERQQEREPIFARIDMAKEEEVRKYLDQAVFEKLKLRYAEQHKFFVYDGVFKKLQEVRRREYEGGLYQTVVVERAVVSDSEINDYYSKNLETFKVPEQIKVHEIVVSTESRAEEILAQLRYRPWYMPLVQKYRLSEFDTLAKQFSTAPSKEVGGETPFFTRGFKPAPVESIAFKMKPNTISKVIKTGDSSFTIIKLDERKPATIQKLDEAKSKIEWNLKRQKQIDLANQYLERIKTEAKVEIFLPPDEEKPPEEGLKTPEEKQSDQAIEPAPEKDEAIQKALPPAGKPEEPKKPIEEKK